MSSSLDPTYPLYPCLSFVGFILCSIPLSWHIQAWNSGTCAFAIWTGLACLNGFVNSMLWAGNTRNIAPVWCDISSKLIIGVSIGIPASILCISRRLYCIISVQTSSITRGDKRRMVIIDLCIAVGLPVIIMILHYIVQGHRFDILEDFGCFPIVYNTLPAYFIYFMWPVLLGVISFIYSSLTLLSFWRRRAQFGQLLSSNSALSPSRYLRLMTLAIIDMMCTVPLGVYTIFIGLNGIDLAPWVSWEETHFDFARAGRVRALFWRSDPSFEVSVELTRWLPVVCAFTFFALFGFASEARKHYWKAFWALAKLCGIKPSTTKKPFVELPSWVKPFKSSTSAIASSTAPPPYSPSSRTSVPQFKLQSSTSYSGSSSRRSFELDIVSEQSCTHIKPLSVSDPYPFPRDVDDQTDIESCFPSSPTSTKVGGHLDVKFPESPFKCEFQRASSLYPGSQGSEPPFSPSSSDQSSSHSTILAHPRPLSSNRAIPIAIRLHATPSEERIYLDGTRSQSPPIAPFAHVAAARPVPAFHRPFSPPNDYPNIVVPHPAALNPTSDGIYVTIQTVSHSASASTLRSTRSNPY